MPGKLFVIVLLLGTTAMSRVDINAAQVDRLSGRWIGDAKLNEAAIRAGLVPTGTISLTISRAGEVLTVERAAGNAKTIQSYRLDGSESEIGVGGRTTTTKLSWNGDVLVLESSTVSGRQTSMLTIEGNRLSVVTTMERGRSNQPIEFTLYYNRAGGGLRIPPDAQR